jgi:hypothetical protein
MEENDYQRKEVIKEERTENRDKMELKKRRNKPRNRH